MTYTHTSWLRWLVFACCMSVVAACGESGTAEPRGSGLVFCDNPDAEAPSCSLQGYSLADDSALAAKLAGCAGGTCHGAGGFTIWSLDLSGSVAEALTPLTDILGSEALYYLVDDLDPDCSKMLTEVTSEPVGLRMPLVGDLWSADEIDCFRSYLNELY